MPPEVRLPASRAVRNWLRARLPEPDVRGKTIVLYSRRTFPKVSWAGTRSDFHGLFSEFHSVLGALAYAAAHGSAGVRVDFRSPLYHERGRGPNWWTYFFESANMRLRSARIRRWPVWRSAPERYRHEIRHLRRLLGHRRWTAGVSVPDDLRNQPVGPPSPADRTSPRAAGNPRRGRAIHRATRFEPGAYVVGVHYRGTDATHKWTGALTQLPARRQCPTRRTADEECGGPRSRPPRRASMPGVRRDRRGRLSRVHAAGSSAIACVHLDRRCAAGAPAPDRRSTST